MEKQINFILQIYSVLLYALIIYVECNFLLPIQNTELYSSWLIDFVILDWIYVNKMTKLIKENP